MKASSVTDKATAINDLKTEHTTEVDGLKTTHAAALAALELSKKEELEKKVQELTAAHETTLSTLETTYSKEIENVKSEHESEKAKTKDAHDKALVDLTAKQETELHTAKESHRKELSKHEDEFRQMKESFEKQMDFLMEQHKAEIKEWETRTKLPKELKHIKDGFDDELREAEERGAAGMKAQMLAEFEARRTHHQTEMHTLKKKASGAMKDLSNAHSAKTASLEVELEKAKADLEEARRKMEKLKEAKEDRARYSYWIPEADLA